MYHFYYTFWPYSVKRCPASMDLLSHKLIKKKKKKKEEERK